MTVSRFLYMTRLPDGSAGCWSTLSGQFLRLDKPWADALEAGQPALLPPELQKELLRMRMLAQPDCDELGQLLSKGQKNAACFRILTTTACNAACPYCYEKGLSMSHMTPDIADDTADFLRRRLEETGETELRLEWFGGEPLLNVKAIDRICGRLRSYDVPFVSHITTNAALLAPETIPERLEAWSLTGVQVSLDGVGREHELAKGLPVGSFDRILQNLHLLLALGCRVRIRIVHAGDTGREAGLIRFLAAEFPERKPYVYLFPLYQVGDHGLRRAMEEILPLEGLLAECGLLEQDKMYRFAPRRGRCFAADGGLTIAPNGDLFSCSHAMQAEHRVGSVRDFSLQNENYRFFIHSDLPQRCLDCVFLPFCRGGCRAAELGMAEMFQCHPYSAVADRIVELCCRA